ncbi:ribosome biogenesis protein WDR12 homolog [Rhipicephalus microplus]|uniref:ribosome biogenesis protein WDR12 homolog n=1 Tax=Rhipicephalus microplus TaxID=6941 RepID=UPI003F6C89DF
MDENAQIQAKFFTKDERYSVPDTPFSISGSTTSEQLSSLINTLLRESSSGDAESDGEPTFDFLIDGELLRETLQEHLEAHKIQQENIVLVEYVEKCPPPLPVDTLVHDDWVSAVHTSDAGILSGCYDNSLHIWDHDGTRKLLIPGHVGPIKSVKWVSVGEPLCTFVSASLDETAMLWQWDRDKNAVESVQICRGHARSVECVDVSWDKSYFATGSFDQMLKVWSADPNSTQYDQSNDESESSRKKQKTIDGKAKTRVPVLTLSGHHEAVTGVQWTDDKEVATCSMDHTLRLWDVDLGGMKSQLVGSKAFLDIAYSRTNNQIISAHTDRHIRLWDVRSKDGAMVTCTYSSHFGWVSSVHWAPESAHHFVSGSYDGFMKHWDVRSPKAPLYDMTGHEDKVLAVDWSLQKYMISGGADCHMKIFEFQ